MPKMNMDKLFIRLGELNIEFPDGFVVGLTSFEFVTKGWAVNMRGMQNYIGREGMEEAIAIASQSTKTVCCWKVDDVIFWDVVLILEHEENAVIMGRKMEQMFIYQIDTGKVKWLI